MSAVSAKSAVSGSTVYHDARSLAGTPPPLPPLPRALLSGSQTDMSQSYGGTNEPPSYQYESDQTGSQAATAKGGDTPRGVDILDLPAPASVSLLSSASSKVTVPFPPGLVQLPTPGRGMKARLRRGRILLLICSRMNRLELEMGGECWLEMPV